jgi:uncharacterized repeat protein (TIGR03943 family)
VSRETENALLLLIGVAIGSIALGGAFTRYVKPALLPYLIATAVVVIGLALVAIVTDVRRGGPPPTDHHGHHHRRGIGWLLVIPVVVLVFIAPPALRPQAAAPTAAAASQDMPKRPFPPLPPGRAPEVSLPEVLIRAAQDNAGTLQGRLVTVTGFTLHTGADLDLGRVVIVCCAADAQLARIRLTGRAVGALAAEPEYTWVRIEGTVSPSTPTLVVHQAVRIDPPANPYA